MNDVGTSHVLQSVQMGHEVPGMRGPYSHVTPRMQYTPRATLQDLWVGSLRARAALVPRSMVPTLDIALTAFRSPLALLGPDPLQIAA
jgi:hypothetical protein